MIRVEVNIQIKHPAKSTFEMISNFEKNPVWQKGMQECRLVTDGELRVGTRYEQLAKFLGKDIISTFEVKEYEPGKMVSASSISGSFPITFTRIVHGDESVSNVQAIIEGESKGFFSLARPLMQWMVNRSIQKDYKRLKVILETTAESA